MVSRKTLNTLLFSAVALSVAGAAYAQENAPSNAPSTAKEKCYGVVKAGKNDCAAAGGSHSCAGQAAVDRAGDEWVAVPQGLCEKLAGGSVTPVSSAVEAPAPATEAPAAAAPAESH